MPAFDLLGAFITIARGIVSGLGPHVLYPFRVELVDLHLDDMDARRERHGAFVIITPYPTRYYVHARVTNRTSRPVYIREVTLAIETQLPIPGTEYQAKRLEPGELIDVIAIFPIEGQTTKWPSGRFMLAVVPTRGQATRVSGRFPVRPYGQ